jgi:hypothetical protein
VGLWHSVRTAFELAQRVNATAARLEELELEWLDKKDALELLLKRLGTRDARRRADGDELVGDPTPPPADGDPVAHKKALRQLARERGMIR